MRLAGWHRVGIVLSVLWAIGAGIYQRNADIRRADEFSQLSFNVCAENERIRQQRDPNFSGSCTDRAVGKYQTFLKGSWGNTAILAFAPIPIAWGLIYLILAVMRWVSAGFRIGRIR
jgi:hypothetical protein